MAKFGVSQPVTRREDRRLLTGAGRFVDDLTPPGTLRAVAVRAPHAHARIVAIDTDAALAVPGVVAVYTAAELAADGIGGIPCLMIPKVRPGTAFAERRQPLLALERVRFAGESVAYVVAETLEASRDGAERVAVDYAPLAAVTDAAVAAAPDAPLVWDDVPGNLCFEWTLGDEAATARAFAAADRIVRLDEVNNRVILNAIETRGALGRWIPDPESPIGGRFELVATTQMPNRMKTQLAEHVLHVPPEAVRVLVHDVGGGFGGKNALYPEQAMTLYAARRLGRPVKWVAERSESFLSDTHGRDNVTTGELALAADGRFLAIRVRTHANLGAYNSNSSAVSPTNIAMICGAYRFAAAHAHVRGMFTHTVPVDAYRGAGRPEITYLLERLVDVAALELGRDPAELRRQNYIPPEAFPFASPGGLTYDAARFADLLDRAGARLALAELPARRSTAAAGGRLRGVGLSTYIERCGGGGGLAETARVRVSPEGLVEVAIGSQSNGQGHETAYSQIVHEALGLPFERIEIVQGDTDRVETGLGTGGSWSVPMGGGALARAVEKVAAKARRIASHLLEAAEADVALADGVFEVQGTDLRLPFEAVAQAAHDPARLPPGETPGLDAEDRFAPANYTFPYGAHLCEVEVDPETGAVRILRYVAVHDFGRALNPLLLAGQVQGGVTQGIGQALMEHTVYDRDGQLLSGSYMDYALPRALDLPAFEFEPVEATPTAANPLGVKGCGEAGATGAPPAVINAILDALKPLGVRHIDMPATPERVWRAIRQARARAEDGNG